MYPYASPVAGSAQPSPPDAPQCPNACGPTACCRSKPSPKWSTSAVTRSSPGVWGAANSAAVSGFSSGGRPSTSLIAAAYIPATPRAVPVPPADAGPSSLTLGWFPYASRSIAGSRCALNATGRSSGSAAPAVAASCSRVGSISSTGFQRPSSSCGRPMYRSSPYGARIRSSNTSWRDFPVARRTTSPISAPITKAWYPYAVPGSQYGSCAASRAAISASSAISA